MILFIGCLAMMLTATSEAVVPQVSLVKLVGGLSQPVHIANAGDGSSRIFLVEQPGRIRIVRNGALKPDPFLDILISVRHDSSEPSISKGALPLSR